ncbi:esterase family protein [Myxococcus sp. K38C18041901]|uniref:alpha/beta hydrolase n=1 Tax=Myxococcus guangdongensis TaxID=2906760 RepID=UPI0020A72CF5|nr:alpha/beta hydrolase-fold protein [Myxococcus guangdongensis]MCP3061096.1 esterase family protein [Myxococcus guangdongensis]
MSWRSVVASALLSVTAVLGGVPWTAHAEEASPVEASTPEARYPVVYLLHSGGGLNSSQWVESGGARATTENQPVITIMPEGGKAGWYTHWLLPRGVNQAWEEFHLNQLIPWVDQNLRTLAYKQGRAIAGPSMAGFGAISCAARRPDLFAYVASFSGALDLGNAAIRTVVTEESARWLNNANGAFGSPFWPFDPAWHINNPLERAAGLRTVAVALYAGSGTWDGDLLERVPAAATARLHQTLDSAGIAHHYEMYGRPKPAENPFGCDGGHNLPCWSYTFSDVLPRMLSVLDGP